jgi:hypothetical protein
MAIAHNMLVLGYHRLLAGTCAAEAYDDRLQARPEGRHHNCAGKALERLGYCGTVGRRG